MRKLILLCGLLGSAALTSGPADAQSVNGFFPFGGVTTFNTPFSNGGMSCGVINTADPKRGSSSFVFRGNGGIAGKFIMADIDWATYDSQGAYTEDRTYSGGVIMTFSSPTSSSGSLKWVNNYIGANTGGSVTGPAIGTFSGWGVSEDTPGIWDVSFFITIAGCIITVSGEMYQ